MNLQKRNNVRVQGNGPRTLVFAHGFGCDQNMWRAIVPHYVDRFRVVTFDLVGAGGSDPTAYEIAKYRSLSGYASDLVEVAREFATGPVVFVGHSVSAMIGMLADLMDPGLFAAHVMIGPSPCYINDGDYVGGFTREDIDSLLDALADNYLGWAAQMAPAIMGVPERPELGAELNASFCRMDPDIARRFATTTFLSDNRPDVARLQTPTLIVQSSEDLIAPLAVGQYLQRTLPRSRLCIVDNVGHCPHLSAPEATCDAMDAFLAASGGDA